MEFGWQDPYSVATRLQGEPGMVLLESGTGHGSLASRSLLAVRPLDVASQFLREVSETTDCLQAGWLSYDLGREVERLPVLAADDRGLPPLAVGRYEAWLVFDHVARTIELRGSGASVDVLVAALSQGRPRAPRYEAPSEWVSSLPRPRYEQAVRDAIDFIRAGDVFQVNISQRLTADWSGDALALYGRVRSRCQAPFMGFADLGGARIVSASPELFLRRRADRIETRPIKGTRPRANDPERDRALAAQLVHSDKDHAENVMIVDLARNDLGRVARYGSVKVERLAGLEAHAGVHHLVSTVSARLTGGTGFSDVISASFPPGSVTGAPKIRAMEIIEELEPVRRGPYCGALVWFEPDGDFDLSVAIRTMIATEGRLDLHVGGAVVADSDPHGEWRESMHKARRLLEAAGGTLEYVPEPVALQ